MASLLWGDFSGVAASVPVVLGLLHHSRAAEREADEIAIRLLQTQGISVEPLVRFFEEIMDLESEAGTDKIPSFLQSHPATEESGWSALTAKFDEAGSAHSVASLFGLRDV